MPPLQTKRQNKYANGKIEVVKISKRYFYKSVYKYKCLGSGNSVILRQLAIVDIIVIVVYFSINLGECYIHFVVAVVTVIEIA